MAGIPEDVDSFPEQELEDSGNNDLLFMPSSLIVHYTYTHTPLIIESPGPCSDMRGATPRYCMSNVCMQLSLDEHVPIATLYDVIACPAYSHFCVSLLMDFLFLVGKLEEQKFSGDSAEAALVACKDDESKVH